jgi:NosR/NirI family nitrous oxide reductase transcriptional regulator
VVDATGYSGKPIHILVALDPAGKILGAKLVEHHEPIVLIGIPEEKIRSVIDHFRGVDVRALAAGTAPAAGSPEIVSGATVTVLVIGDSIIRSALKVVQARGLGAPADAASQAAVPSAATIDETRSEIADWQTLIGDDRPAPNLSPPRSMTHTTSPGTRSREAARERSADESFVDLCRTRHHPHHRPQPAGRSRYRQMTEQLRPGQTRSW